MSVLHQVLHHLSLSSIKFVGTAAGSCGIFGVQLLLPVGEEDCVTIFRVESTSSGRSRNFV